MFNSYWQLLRCTNYKNTSEVSDFGGKKILGGFHWKLAIHWNLDGRIQMVN
jgi:hypothetical protein